MRIIQNADGSVNVQSQFDESEMMPEYVSQYHTGVDELSAREKMVNKHVENKNMQKALIAAKVEEKKVAVLQTQRKQFEWKKFLLDVAKDASKRAREMNTFGSLEYQPRGFDVSCADVASSSVIGGNMATGYSETDSMGGVQFLNQGMEDFGQKIIQPDVYRQPILDDKFEFGYTSINADALDKARVKQVRTRQAKNIAMKTIKSSRRLRGM